MIQSIKEFQSNGGLPREPPDQLANASGERYHSPREADNDTPGVKVEELVAALAVPSGAER